MGVGRRGLIVWLLGCAAVAAAVAQAPRLDSNEHPAFEVSSINPSDPTGPGGQGWSFHGRQVEIRYQTVASLMMYAYGIHPKQIVDGPAWMDKDRWDIRGVLDVPGEPSHAQFQETLKGLLADRFGLTLRHEGRDMQAYTVTVAKSGSKLELTKSDADAQPNQDAGRDSQGVWLKMLNVNMPQFALYMQFFVDRPIVDRTGLKGRYDVMLKWKPVTQEASASGEDYPELLQATQEQLGLKLVPERDMVDALVVVKVERPTAN